MHSNGRLWATAIVALILGIVAGGAAMSIAERSKVTKLQASLAAVVDRLEDSDRKVQDLSDKLKATPTPTPEATATTEIPSTPQIQPTATRRFGFITSLTPGASGKVVVDYASYLTGEAAAKAAKKAGEESPPPNDYFIVNDDQKTVTLRLDPAVKVRLTTRPGEGSVVGGYETDAATLAGYVSAETEDTVPLRSNGYWLTVRDGAVIEIEEQYAP